jgi:5'-nucleotidase
VTAGAATPSVTLPEGVSGTARLRVDAAPSGTSALLPAFEIAEPKAVATVDAYTLPIIFEGSRTLVGFEVRGKAGRPTGTVTVSEGDTTLGSATLQRGLGIVVADTRSLSPGRHTLTVSYAGDDTYAPATDQVRVTVLRFPGGHR